MSPQTMVAASNNPIVLQPDAEPVPGYRLLHTIGRGGYGEVWKAAGPDGKYVALKFIRLTGPTPPHELAALKIVKTLSHRSLLPVFEIWNTDGYLIIGMELADRTLMDRFHECKSEGLPGIPFAELVAYISDAAAGVDFLNSIQHCRESDSVAQHDPAGATTDSKFNSFSLRLGGIQHRDIKPENLFLVGHTAKVADFGLAKFLENTRTTHTGAMTPAYAAPEFFQGQTSNHSDQYSLAMTYCFLRFGRLPFVGTPAAIMAGHLTKDPDLSMFPAAEARSIAKALAKKPEGRWPDCGKFVSALRESQVAQNLGQPCSVWPSKRAVVVGVFAAILVFVAMFVWFEQKIGYETDQRLNADRKLTEANQKLEQAGEATHSLQRDLKRVQAELTQALKQPDLVFDGERKRLEGEIEKLKGTLLVNAKQATEVERKRLEAERKLAEAEVDADLERARAGLAMKKLNEAVQAERKRLNAEFEAEIARLRSGLAKQQPRVPIDPQDVDGLNRKIFAKVQRFVDANPKIIFEGSGANFGWEIASRPFRTKTTLDRYEHEGMLDFLGRAVKYAPHRSDPAFAAVIAELRKYMPAAR